MLKVEKTFKIWDSDSPRNEYGGIKLRTYCLKMLSNITLGAEQCGWFAVGSLESKSVWRWLTLLESGFFLSKKWLRIVASAQTMLSSFCHVSHGVGPILTPLNRQEAGEPSRAWILPDCLWELLGTSSCRCQLAAHSGRSLFHLGHSRVSSTGNTHVGISWSCGWRWWAVEAEPASRGTSWWVGTSEISILGWISTLPQKMYCWNRSESQSQDKKQNHYFLKYQLPPSIHAAHPSTCLPQEWPLTWRQQSGGWPEGCLPPGDSRPWWPAQSMLLSCMEVAGLSCHLLGSHSVHRGLEEAT